MKKFLFTLITIFSVFFVAVSCSKKADLIELNNEDLASLDPQSEWLLIVTPYVSCHSEAGWENKVINHVRKSEIRQKKGSKTVKTDDNFELWYFIDEGWISSSSVKLYSNRLKAKSAADGLK